MFAVFAAVYFWAPKIFGIKLNEAAGKLNFWLFFIGFNVTFIPWFFMGIEGMPRRVFTYPAMGDLPWLNAVSSVGAGIMALGAIAFVLNVIFSKLESKVAEPLPDDPWGGSFSLEWATACPPPEFNFHALPPIRSERPVWDMTHPELIKQRM
jgi:cytochrome c oxidase subunit 1